MGWGAFVVCRAIVGCNCGTQGSAAPSSPPTTHLLPRPTALPPHPTWLAPSFPSAPTCHFLTPRQLLPPPHPPPPLPPLSSSIPASLSCANPPPHLSHRRPSSASSHPPCKSLPTPSLHADSAGAPQQPHLLPRWRPQRHAAGHAGRGESRRGQVRVRGGGDMWGALAAALWVLTARLTSPGLPQCLCLRQHHAAPPLSPHALPLFSTCCPGSGWAPTSPASRPRPRVVAPPPTLPTPRATARAGPLRRFWAPQPPARCSTSKVALPKN